MKQNLVFLSGSFTLFVIVCLLGCTGDSKPAVSVQAAAAYDIISFVDLDVRPSFESLNLGRVGSIVSSVRSRFMESGTIRRFSLNVYPLYYATGDVNTIFSFENKNDSDAGLSEVERDDMLEKFSIKGRYRKFSKRFLCDSTKTYKEIWRSIYRLKDAVSKCKAPNICVIYYSDFAEFRWPVDSKESRFLFTQRLHNHHLVLDCNQLDAARQQMTDTTTVMGAAIAECRQVIEQAKRQGKSISVKLVDCNSDIKMDNCSGGRPLEDYWSAFFQALGIEDIGWTAEDQLNSEIGKL